MPTGFRVLVTPEEIRQHCLDRAAWHDQQVAAKREELPKVKALVARMKDSGSLAAVGTSLSGYLAKGAAAFMTDPDAPVRDLERDIKCHAQKAASFSFIAQHLHTEDYDLTEHDLQRLEFVA